MKFVGTFANWRRLIESRTNTKPKLSYEERETFYKPFQEPYSKKFRNYFKRGGIIHW